MVHDCSSHAECSQPPPGGDTGHKDLMPGVTITFGPGILGGNGRVRACRGQFRIDQSSQSEMSRLKFISD